MPTSAQYYCDNPSTLANLNGPSGKFTQDKVFCVNVIYHIVRKTDQTGGYSVGNLDMVHQTLNQAYNIHNIYFVNIGYDYINNDNYYNLNYSDYILETVAGNPLSIYNINHDNSAINIYLIEELFNNRELGRAISIPGKSCVVDNQFAATNVMAHEVGHCLGLYHTDYKDFCIENIANSTNCTNCGDKICDTPADRGLLDSNGEYLVDSSCILYPHNYGGMYSPDTKNIMSYTRISCYQRFTKGQMDLVKTQLESHHILAARQSSNCTNLNGPNVICNVGTYTTNSYNGNAINWTWSNSAVATLNVINNNTVQLNPVTGASGSGKLTATSIGAGGTSNIQELSVYVGLPELQYSCPGNVSGCLKICRANSYIQQNKITPIPFGVDATSIWEWVPITTNFTYQIVSLLGRESILINPLGTTTNIQFKVRMKNDCGWSNWLFYNLPVVYCSGTQIEARQNVSITLYPNPANNEINVNSEFEELNKAIVQIYTLQGNFVAEKNITNNTIYTDTLKNGWYIFKIVTSNSVYQHKIEIKH